LLLAIHESDYSFKDLTVMDNFKEMEVLLWIINSKYFWK
jgi:hypothetical protein